MEGDVSMSDHFRRQAAILSLLPKQVKLYAVILNEENEVKNSTDC